MKGGTKKRSLRRKIISWLIDIAVVITISSSFILTYKVIKNSFSPKRNVITSFRVGENNPLSDYEMKSLFPNLKKDWDFIQSLVNTKNLRLPAIYYQTNDNDNDLISDGTYYWSMNIINIDRSIFATSTESYKRYVLLHEMYHMASYLTNDYQVEIDNHCYMVNNLIFSKIGDYIGDSQLGDSEQMRYSKFCNKNNNEK